MNFATGVCVWYWAGTYLSTSSKMLDDILGGVIIHSSTIAATCLRLSKLLWFVEATLSLCRYNTIANYSKKTGSAHSAIVLYIIICNYPEQMGKIPPNSHI